MYKVKHYLRLLWWLIPICSTRGMNTAECAIYLSDYYKTFINISTVKKFTNNTLMVNGWKRPNIGIRMRVEKC